MVPKVYKIDVAVGRNAPQASSNVDVAVDAVIVHVVLLLFHCPVLSLFLMMIVISCDVPLEVPYLRSRVTYHHLPSLVVISCLI